ncbi:hypothetical protein [Euzebya pacifica]|nr:hypothetical protein [Euzebya pacifica]
MSYPCGKPTLGGGPCQNTTATPGAPCGASHNAVGGLGAGLKAWAAGNDAAAAAAADPFHDPAATQAAHNVAVRMGNLRVLAARAAALGRSSKGMTAPQFADRNTRGKFIAAEAHKTIEMWRKEDPVAPNDNPAPVLPVTEMAETMSARQMGDTAATYMQRAMRKAGRAKDQTDPAERADLLSSAQSYALAAHKLYDFAAQDTEAVAIAGHNLDPQAPDVHRAQAAKAVKTAWTENGRIGGRHNAAAASERLRQVRTHLVNALAGYGEPVGGEEPLVVPTGDPPQLLTDYKEHSKAISELLTMQLNAADGTNPDGTIHDGTAAYAEADAMRLRQAYDHTRHAINVLDTYVDHPDHNEVTA